MGSDDVKAPPGVRVWLRREGGKTWGPWQIAIGSDNPLEFEVAIDGIPEFVSASTDTLRGEPVLRFDWPSLHEAYPELWGHVRCVGCAVGRPPDELDAELVCGTCRGDA